MSSGLGRGRGWLKLNNKNQVQSASNKTASIIGISNPKSIVSESDYHLLDDAKEEKQNPNMHHLIEEKKQKHQQEQNQEQQIQSQDYLANEKLIENVRLLNLDDDGILMNQKLKFIIETWQKEYKTEDEIRKSLETLFQVALRDDKLPSKLITMIYSHLTRNKEINNVNITKFFLILLQNQFEEKNQLKKTNPNMFRNFTIMFGEFYYKWKQIHGQGFRFLTEPFLIVLQTLLENNDVLDLKLLTKQILTSGLIIKSIDAEKFHNLLMQIRLKLVKDTLNTESKLWLLLIIDYTNNFSIDNNLITFYDKELGQEAVMYIKLSKNYFICETTNNDENVLINEINNTPTINNHIGGRPILGSGANKIHKNIPHN